MYVRVAILFIIWNIAWPHHFTKSLNPPHHFTKSLNPPHIIKVHVPCQGSDRPCVCVLVESMLYVSTMISLLNFGTVLTVWYFSFYFIHQWYHWCTSVLWGQFKFNGCLLNQRKYKIVFANDYQNKIILIFF